MPVHAGQYKDRIAVKRDTGERNAFGGSKNTTKVVQRPWCKVRTISDNEVNGTNPKGQLILEFEMRYSKSLENPTNDMFIEFRGKQFDIISALNLNMRNEKLVIMGKMR